MDGSVKTTEQIMAEIEDLRQIIADFEAGETGGSILSKQLAREISARNLAEEELSKERNKFKSMLSAMQSGIAICDLDFNIIYQNEPITEVFGDRTGEKCYRAFEGSDEVCEGCPVILAYEDGKSHTSLREVTAPSGEIQFWENTANPIRDANGEIFSCLEVCTNVTERKKAGEALQESEERFRLMMEQSPSVIEFYDLDGLQVEVSHSYEVLWGFPAEHTVGKFNVLKSKEVEDSGLIEYVNRAYAGETVKLPEYEFDSTGETEAKGLGRKRWLSTRIYPLKDKAGNVNNIVITHEDITDRKLAENESESLMRNLELKNKELQSIVYTASHDLKSPLVNIEGFGGELSSHCKALGELLNDIDLSPVKRSKVDFVLKEEIPESLQFIRNGTRKMKVLLDGLLQVSRFGSDDIQIEPLDMNRLIKLILDTMQFQIDEKSISVSVDDLPGCLGDLHQISQVFSNILDNAIKYLDPSRKGAIQVSAITDNGECTYCIEDNGIGIDKNHQNKVFEIFHRLEPDGSIDGDGLGLTIVSRILDRHSGTIQLESEPNKGTQFHVTLPRA